MKKALSFLLVLLLFPVIGETTVIKITIDAPIHPITYEYIQKSIEKAEERQAQLLIIFLNTPGGLDTSMRKIIERILSSSVPVAAYVHPQGARAASAGFFIGMACDIFVMSPGTSTGAAHPVGISATGQQMDETMAEKITEDAASYIRTLAEKRGRNVKLAEDAVKKSLSFTETEALKNNLIDFIAANEQEILNHFDGKTIERFDSSKVTLDLKGSEIVHIPMSSRQKFLLTISDPNLAYILLMIGLLGLYFEFANPGAILPGVLGGICLLMAIFAFQILPINYVGLILILLAVGLFVLEIKIQSYGILSAGGIIAMLIGSIMLIDSPIPELKPSLKFIVPVVIGLSIIFIFLITIAVRAHSRKATTGKEGLLGERGIVKSDLNPEGLVFVHGELWKAESDEPLPKGTKVKVVEVTNGLKIKVIKE